MIFKLFLPSYVIDDENELVALSSDEELVLALGCNSQANFKVYITGLYLFSIIIILDMLANSMSITFLMTLLFYIQIKAEKLPKTKLKI